MDGKRPRKKAKTDGAGESSGGGGGKRAPKLAYLGRLCRVKAAEEAEWQAFRVLAYKGRDKQTIELGNPETEDDAVTRSIELRDHTLYVLVDVAWGPESDADEATADDPETFVPLLLFEPAGKPDADARGRMLAYSPHSGKHPQQPSRESAGRG